MKTLLVFDSIETSLTLLFLSLSFSILSHSLSSFSLSLAKKVHLNHTISVCVHKLWLFHPFCQWSLTHFLFLSFMLFLSLFFFSRTLRKIRKRKREREKMHLDHQALLRSVHHFSRKRKEESRLREGTN